MLSLPVLRWGHVRGHSPVECVRLGIACGVANAMTLYSGHVDKLEVGRLLPLIAFYEK